MNTFASMLVTSSLVPASPTSAPSAIPYRTATSVPTGSLASALIITILVLVALVGCVVYARRRGWLAGTGIGVRPTSGSEIDIRASRRVSLATTVHVVRCGDADYLLVETMRGTTATISPLQKSPEGQGRVS